MGGKNEFLQSLAIWYSFLLSIIIYAVIVGIVRPYPFQIQPYIDFFSSGFKAIPLPVKILYFMGIGEFIALLGARGVLKGLFSEREKSGLVIMWGIADSIAIYGLLAAIITKNGIVFPPLAILSLIAVFYWVPKKEYFEKTTGAPDNF